MSCTSTCVLASARLSLNPFTQPHSMFDYLFYTLFILYPSRKSFNLPSEKSMHSICGFYFISTTGNPSLGYTC
ncbi:hypothetical protein WN55_10236 [Dufourea novaeangliae]|uniref:Uncharacterized protein n=1 Tax=Dufourea novaeangliae TaxID=178035 RepID=A0A154P3A6_DUFNO|nr:hypothetical protein WN55_10236 [Dufourea novaeangliae]